jgi:predicted NodU family carbamoyl transferase
LTLGINAGIAASHDPSACLVDESGEFLAFVEEERLTRVRHSPGDFPVLRAPDIVRAESAVLTV